MECARSDCGLRNDCILTRGVRCEWKTHVFSHLSREPLWVYITVIPLLKFTLLFLLRNCHSLSLEYLQPMDMDRY